MKMIHKKATVTLKIIVQTDDLYSLPEKKEETKIKTIMHNCGR
ncbi:hypothetical protein [Methanolapillus ohkumae]